MTVTSCTNLNVSSFEWYEINFLMSAHSSNHPRASFRILHHLFHSGSLSAFCECGDGGRIAGDLLLHAVAHEFLGSIQIILATRVFETKKHMF